MNYLKIVNNVAMVLIFAGFMLMLGAGAVITNWLDRNFNYYEEQEGDEE